MGLKTMNMFSQMTGEPGSWIEGTLEQLEIISRNINPMITKQDIKDYEELKSPQPDSVRHDNVNHPVHYTNHPSGIECIQITEHMSFLMGNAMKYVWRADFKNGVEDLQKAIFYLNREIENRTKAK